LIATAMASSCSANSCRESRTSPSYKSTT
jgi:hypothetical protein